MKQLARFLSVLFLALAASFLIVVPQVSAADIRANDSIIITSDEKNLEDMYLFGGNVRVDAPVRNDIVVAGGDVALNSDTTGSIMAAGGTVNIRGDVGNTLRVTGGNILIEGKITRDVVIAGGSITITKTAAIGRDLIINGGQVRVEGPVQGKVILNGGEATLNNTVGESVEGNVGKLILGSNAVINGNLTYASEEKADFRKGAVVQGRTNYKQIEKPKEESFAALATVGSLYKLVADIILSVLFIMFFTRFVLAALVRMKESPVKSGAFGFAYLILFPLAAVLLLVLLWLGLLSLLFYAITVIISIFLAKIFLGWMLLRWWENRNNKDYLLDWKAGIIGPIAFYLLLLIPVIGWLVAGVLFLIALGALLQQMVAPLSQQRLENRPVKPAVARKKK